MSNLAKSMFDVYLKYRNQMCMCHHYAFNFVFRDFYKRDMTMEDIEQFISCVRYYKEIQGND